MNDLGVGGGHWLGIGLTWRDHRIRALEGIGGALDSAGGRGKQVSQGQCWEL